LADPPHPPTIAVHARSASAERPARTGAWSIATT
jgi:hypothetical protein